MELKSQTDSFYVRVSLFYQGADKYPYLVTDSSFENWSDPSIDSIFIFYNQGLVTYDSSILHGTNMFIWPLMPLEQVKTRRFTHVNNGLIQVSRKWTTLDDNGTVINTEETTGTISILQNNSNVFEQNYEEWVPGFPSSFDYYFKVTFSDFRNPLYGLMPDYPFVESDAYLPFGWEFPKFAAEIWNDRDGLSGENMISIVEAHEDSLPTRVRFEYYNVPGWVETHLFEYE